MDSFEFNKIAGAVLATALGVLAVGIIAEIIFQPPHHEEPGYVIAVAETAEESTGADAAEPEVEPIAERLQVANVEEGMAIAKRCQACHTFEQGGPARVGPNLWGIVGDHVAHASDFGYSDALEKLAGEGMTWTYDELDDFLANPRGDIPGTAMSFAGIRQPEDRADVIAYLRTLSDDPEPLPPPPADDADTSAAAPDAAGSEAGSEAPAPGTAAPAEQPEAAPQPPAAAAPDAPAADAPTQDAPAQDAPAQDAPAQRTE